ncbi:MAG: protein-L-isoaspartate(D-aspartate) O-methyltransferase [Rhodobacteraceae bacterium]|nr:protein-L-isoaspartate(D-aspartate) O-methyltransferase [Paracoccaceae bacterium]
MPDFDALRTEMVARQISARGVRSPLVLKAMRQVPREAFVPASQREFAYQDTPLPIGAGQTISQPYIVAYMTEALGLSGGETVLEIGTGSGYAAAVLSMIAAEVFTVERIAELAENSRAALRALSFDNVHIHHGDGTRGWAEHAPYDAIIVTAGGPKVPASLKQQLKIGGKLVIPVGDDQTIQELLRVTRLSEQTYRTEEIAGVRFVPLIGDEGWARDGGTKNPSHTGTVLSQAISNHCEPFGSIEKANIDCLIERIANARIVLLGEATHGTSEFYQMRDLISRELIERRCFDFVAIGGDWPDAEHMDHYVRHAEYPPSEWSAFARFPQWMWRNEEVRSFVEWLRKYNEGKTTSRRAAFYGLDLYSLYVSIDEVLSYLEGFDPKTAEFARQRYSCLTPWQSDPAAYRKAALRDSYSSCETAVAGILANLLGKRKQYSALDGEHFMKALYNARVVTNAERYYRIMYYGGPAFWNLRDRHMFETLTSLLEARGPDSKAIVWAHNSHIGNAAATEMSARGEFNIGELCRKKFGSQIYSIGFGTHAGTVAAATHWGGPMNIMKIRPSLARSYERLCHDAAEANFFLPLHGSISAQRELAGLRKPRMERAIGVIYRPESELSSHYFQAVLPDQFDEYIWFDETCAVSPLKTQELAGLPNTNPFGL